MKYEIEYEIQMELNILKGHPGMVWRWR